MSDQSSYIKVLFLKYSTGIAGPEEVQELLTLLKEGSYDDEITAYMQDQMRASEPEANFDAGRWEDVLIKIKKQTTSRRKRIGIKSWIAVAAVMLLTVSIGLIFLLHNKKQNAMNSLAYTSQISPGKQGATLTLANGKKIRLTDAKNGEIAKEAGIIVTKTAYGQLVYELKETNDNLEKINTLSTAKGEAYILMLPDKSKVWLNAASSLTYSAGLLQRGIRMVKLEGEAYFEITKDKKHPFIVRSRGQDVEVLGTHFNINAYSDESFTRTTLLEGSVRLNRDRVLKPNDQATLDLSGKLSVEQVDVQEAIAWKNGKFIFNSEDIASVMRKLSRWYNVEVIYKDERPVTTFTGVISRYDDISEILNKINYTGGVHLSIQGRRIVVMP